MPDALPPPKVPSRIARVFRGACALFGIPEADYARAVGAAWADAAGTPPLDALFETAGRQDLASYGALLRLHSPRLAHAIASRIVALVEVRRHAPEAP